MCKEIDLIEYALLNLVIFKWSILIRHIIQLDYKATALDSTHLDIDSMICDKLSF